MFSGKDEDFENFAERIDAWLSLLKVRTVLLDQEKLPEETDANFSSGQNKLKKKRFVVWWELVQCLDRKSLSLVETAKPNSTQAWKLSQVCFKGQEPPPIHQLLKKLTNLRMNSRECMGDYLMRAEDLQLNQTDVEENVSDQMLCSVALKGFPNSFASFVTIFKFSHEAKTFADLE